MEVVRIKEGGLGAARKVDTLSLGYDDVIGVCASNEWYDGSRLLELLLELL